MSQAARQAFWSRTPHRALLDWAVAVAVVPQGVPGWDDLRPSVVGSRTVAGRVGANAMVRCLHTGTALLIALFLSPGTSSLWRPALQGALLLMAAALVYTGEHHVVDLVRRVMTAGVGGIVVAAVRRHRSRLSAQDSEHHAVQQRGVMTPIARASMGYSSRPVAFGQQAPLLSILSQTRTSVEIRGGRPCWAPRGYRAASGGLASRSALRWIHHGCRTSNSQPQSTLAINDCGHNETKVRWSCTRIPD